MKGKAQFNVIKGTKGFNIEKEKISIKEFEKACNTIGVKALILPCGGGCDANIYNEKGIQAINLGIGMEKVHTKEEFIKIKNLNLALNLLKELV